MGNMDKSGRQNRLDARDVEEACDIGRTAAAGWRPEIEGQWVWYACLFTELADARMECHREHHYSIINPVPKRD